jgi:sec-independent protein translocase protein TatB
MAGTGLTGFLQNLTGTEMIAIAIVALVVLGPDRLPEMARGAGRMMHKLRTMTEGMQSEVRDVMADPSMQPLKELGELAARPRQKLTEYALEAEAEERAKREAAAAERQRAEAADDDSTDDDSTADSSTATSVGSVAASAPGPTATSTEDVVTGEAGRAALSEGGSGDAAPRREPDEPIQPPESPSSGTTSATHSDGDVTGDEPVSREPG